MEETTVDFSKNSPYSRPVKRNRFQRFKDKATYRHQIKFINSLVPVNSSYGIKVLDVGCGSGVFLEAASLSSRNVQYCGLDYDHRLLQEASERTSLCEFYQGSAEDLPFEKESFDVIVSLQNIEHLYNPEKFISECSRVLKKNGYVILATPNPSGLAARFLKEKWNSSLSQMPDHVSVKSPQEWKKLFEQYSFEVVTEGTTFFTGFGIVQRTPLKYLNYILLYYFGNIPWEGGEAFQAVFRLTK
jgi:ubiquinone/menaquinone biosynthesis C-methylase UbiE